ncbi:prolipoprotein diacylglyceryl transferase [bacterium]|nr:prolipoprotein diacylglyceryl transferase [bacterium]
MIDLIHTAIPDPILITIGQIKIYYYGLFIVSGILAAILVIFKLADIYRISKNTIIDMSFWLVISGIIGARIYHVFLELPYYAEAPASIFKIWQGGLAIHGALIVGAIIIFFFTRKHKLNFFHLASIIAPGLALAQAIGRWGNYFNQELFGKPTNLPWGIPIEPTNRITEYYNSQFFHPTFLYESLSNFFIFSVLIFMHYLIYKKKLGLAPKHIVFSYLILYSIFRFLFEFIRIDFTPIAFGLRFPQLISLAIIIASLLLIKRGSLTKPLQTQET